MHHATSRGPSWQRNSTRRILSESCHLAIICLLLLSNLTFKGKMIAFSLRASFIIWSSSEECEHSIVCSAWVHSLFCAMGCVDKCCVDTQYGIDLRQRRILPENDRDPIFNLFLLAASEQRLRTIWLLWFVTSRTFSVKFSHQDRREQIIAKSVFF